MEWQETIAWRSERVHRFLSGPPWYPIRSNPTPAVPFQYWLNRTSILYNSCSSFVNYKDITHKSQLATTNSHSHSTATLTHIYIFIKMIENDIQCQSQVSIQYNYW